MKFLDTLIRRLTALGVALAAVAILASMFTIGYSVVMRYAFNQPAPWVDELAGYLLIAAVMLAAADALFHGEHIAVDILTERLSTRGKRRVLLGGLLAIAATALLLALEGIDMVAFSRMVGLKSNGYLAVPMWIPQLLVPVGAILLLVAAAHQFVTAWRARTGPPRVAEPHRTTGIE